MDEICVPIFVKYTFGFSTDAKIETSLFMISGHSYGWGTLLKVGYSNSRVVLKMYQWVLPIRKLMEQKKITKLYKKTCKILNTDHFNTQLTVSNNKILDDLLGNELH